MDSQIANNIRNVRAHIPAHVTLVCVSKFQSVEAIREAYNAGERHFGESRVQELKAKIPQLPADIHWHFIGHLQTNKVRDLLKLRPYLIHSVDSLHLLEAINTEAAKQGITQDVLLEIHTAKETTKTGLLPSEIGLILDHCRDHLATIRVRGCMTMATNTDDETEIRRCFTEAATLTKSLSGEACLSAERSYSETVFQAKPVLSMGMSDDYQIAIECGATMVRIGSTIFGERTYH